MKRYNSGTVRWKRGIEQDLWEGRASTSSLGTSLSLYLHMFTNLEALRTLSLWVFMEASLCRHDWFYHWPLVMYSTFSPFPLPRGEGGGWDWKVQPSNHVVGSPGNQPQSSGSSKNHIITITRYLHCSQGNFGSSVQEIGPKTKYRYIYYKLQYHTMCLRDLSKLVLKDLFEFTRILHILVLLDI